MNAETLVVGDSELRIPWGALRIMGVTAAVLAIAVFGVQVAPYVNRPVADIRINGHLEHLNALQLAAAADVAPGTKLFAVDLDAVRGRIEALPWVGHAEIHRSWPAAIVADVQERKPVARWGDSGLLDDEGRAFSPPAADLPAGLPQLSGPADRVSDVWTAYQKLSATLDGSLFALAGLNLDARGEWTARTRGGITLRLGLDDPAAQGALIVGTVTRSLADRIAQVAYIDLRYPNGFSVGWISGNEAEHCASAAGTAAGKARAACNRKDASSNGVKR